MEPASDAWLKVYPGPQKYRISVEWLALFGDSSETPDFDFSKASKLSSPLRLESDYHVPLAKFKDGEELAWEVGSQLCGLIADFEKHHASTLNSSRHRIEYFTAKKERRQLAKKQEKPHK